MSKNKKVFFGLLGFYALGLLAWPIMSYFAVFALDDPSANKVLVSYIIFSIWAYPLFVVAGYFWGHYKRNRSVLQIILKTSLPLLSAIWYFLIPLGGALIWTVLTEERISSEEITRRREELEARLDPIYQARINVIQSRDPVADAKEAISRNEIAFLPSSWSDTIYCGINNNFYDPSFDHEHNRRVCVESDLLSSLKDMLAIDPSHNFPDDDYFSDTFKEYGKVVSDYDEVFNTTILDHINREQ